MKLKFLSLVFFLSISVSYAQTVLKPQQVFDGETLHKNWIVIVENNQITYAGPEKSTSIPEGAKIINLDGKTLMPGIIEGHSHILLHPYNETGWNDQVLKESPVERSIRATVHVKNSLMAGITTMRDLGTEGAGYSDVYIKKTIEEGIIPGPRLQVAGPAIVATGAYGPKGFYDAVHVPLGADEVSGVEEATRTARRQLGNGTDVVKIYADYHWKPGAPSMPTFTVEEIKAMVNVAESAGTYATAHATTAEGMRRAIEGGVETIEHGDNGTPEVFQLMKEKGIALCPTVAAGDAIERYNGWRKGIDPEPKRITSKKESFKNALKAGVTILFGGDVGVFTHGENYREMELLVEYGMKPLEVLKSATSINAKYFHMDKVGNLKKGYLADIIAVEGDPSEDIKRMENVGFVMKDGHIYKNE
ncbi:MAG: amidohydrolase family protein [Gillisia sp.]